MPTLHRPLPALLLLATSPLAAQECLPSATSNEARLFARQAVAIAFAPSVTPVDPAGSLRLGIDLTALPPISDALATPTTCRPGKGPENADPLPGFARVRLRWQFAGGVAAEIGWLPPVRLEGVRANLFGVALSRTMPLRPRTDLTLRVHGDVGTVTGPFTCPDAALADPASECFQGTRSEDRYRPTVLGADALVSWRGDRLAPFVGAGYARLMPRFRVAFTDRLDRVDSTRVRVDLDRLALVGGVTWHPHARWRASIAAAALPADGVTLRLQLDAALRGPSR